MMDFDSFFKRKYDNKKYNCAHFIAEVWEQLTGKNIADDIKGFLQPEREIPSDLRSNFCALAKPVSPCIAVFFRRGYEPHTGVYINRKIFHITREGVQYQPVDVVGFGFNRIRYYTC